MRLFMLCAALALAYIATRRRLISAPRYKELGGNVLIVFLGTVVLVVALQIATTELRLFLHADARAIAEALRIVALDAALAGWVVGYVLADQQNGAEQAARSYLIATPQDGDEAATGRLAVVKAALTNTALVVLLLLAVFPYRDWQALFGRFQTVRAAGFELTLTALNSQRSSTEDRGRGGRAAGEFGSKPGSNVSGRGFSTERLQRLATFTYPAAGAASIPRITENPEPYLHLSVNLSAGDSREPIRQVHRDRAQLLLMNRQSIAELASSVMLLGSVQERILRLFRPHLECVNSYVDATEDRRLLQYELHAVAQRLVFFVKKWTEVELKAVTRDVDVRISLNSAIDQLNSLVEPLSDLHKFISDSLSRWQPNGTGADSCHSRVDIVRSFSEIQQEFRKLSLEDLRANGFAPYLTYVAAYVLSAVGAHDLSAKLIRDWLDGRTAVETYLVDQTASPSHPAMLRSQLELIRTYRVQVIAELIYIQAIAENSDPGVSVDENLLGSLVNESFPIFFRRAGQDITLSEWRVSGNGRCRHSDNSWRQYWVASYLSYLAAYMQVMNSRAEHPDDIQPSEYNNAKILAEVNWECFRNPIPNEAVRMERNARYNVISVSVRVNLLLISNPPSASERERLISELDLALRQALPDLSEAGRQSDIDTQKCDRCDARFRQILRTRDNSYDREARTLRRLLERLRSS